MNTEHDPFLRAFKGPFAGMLRWEQFDALWQRLRENADNGWYIYAVGEPHPGAPSDRQTLLTFLDEIEELIRREHKESYCGIVYVDDFEAPTFVKIFDPNNLGMVCGFSDNPPLPGWILSRIEPVDLSAIPQTGQRRRWWRKLFG